ncbi:hypothetical protein JHK87_052511 [Glycine soja]|nr:hypothetical protein JHK87_052511 [Glycine soja]
MSRNVRRGGQIWVHIFPDKPVIVRPTETCMGSGFQLLKYVVPNTDKFVPFVMTQLRCFDFYKLHSWAGGLTNFGDGRNQQSTSEVVNAYYAAALMGLAYGHTHLLTRPMESIKFQHIWCLFMIWANME